MDTGRIETEVPVLVVEPPARSRIADAARGVVESEEAADVRTVSSVDDALATLEERSVACVCTAQDLPEGTGLELLEAVGDAGPPTVLAPDAGDESLASAAVSAGVTEYVPGDRPRADLESALERAIRTGRRRRNRRARARAFDAVFDDPDSFAWVLEPDGRIRRANERALEAVDASAADVRGRPFPASPWWTPLEDDAIREAVEAAADGEIVHREVTLPSADDDSHATSGAAGDADARTLEVTIRPVRDDGGTIRSLFVRTVDVTDRVALETELRESEELHRVTLNNMTDTVLVTDDDGAFTYVCPNVHFIFGYSDEEIYEMGTIDELLEPDLFDREQLAEEGVLTNLECTATDKAGREHTLLVNVREVSIQGGTTLYSCRDVTTRKRREEALTALHRTARDLLYAETDHEIATAVVDDATDVLDCEAAAAYLFDTDENVLRPAAHSAGMTDLHGPLSAHRAADDTLPGEVFVEGEPRFVPNLQESAAFSNPTTELRSVAVVPLGDHGVFVAGADEVEAFDAVSRELTDLLAATAEAALDRVERERRLRERDRELQRQNRRLTRLNQVNEIIREIDGALVGAETQEAIATAVCDRLTAADRFAFAWIGAADAEDDRLAVQAHGGSDHGRDYLDAVSLSLESDEPAVRTAAEGTTTVVSNVARDLRDQSWRRAALSRDYQSVVSVPLSYDGFTYGVLTVYADRPEAFDEMTRTVLSELGETIAAAIAAVERKRALLSDARTRLEFDVNDEGFVFTRLARRAECTISFDGGMRHREDGTALFATVEGADPEAVASAAADLVAVRDVQVLGDERGDDERGGTLRLQFSRPFFAVRLADHGVVVRSVDATPDGARLVVDVPRSVEARTSADVVATAFPDVDLRSKRRVERTSARDLRSALLDRLTDRQLEVAQVAYYSGYFETPRDRSGEEVAETLEISPAAFYRHARTVQRKLFAILFEELDVQADVAQMVE
ncbi:bacterio-opsin activator domain-containing protein [Halopiger goleimassiliensis]|uniref:bacterio-opsin activator domain-containing protein n=1 Tax=Halopiger goleimassiliensis TaxID=1293048 RepID=UPI0006777143|nr:bacterio-opsin activator domain-containing protein [Halopiger goleimassiliensis]